MATNKLRNIKLVIEYDGTNYCGWQIQKNGPTVQETLTKILTRITGHKITLYGAGRTDSGVHSIGQTANFLTASRLTPYQFLRAINDHLPRDIVTRSVKEVPKSFNSRYAAKSKIYRYTILNSIIPKVFNRNLYYFLPYKISIDRMKKAVRYFVGRHNFKAFAAKSPQKDDCNRRIYSIKITQDTDYVYIDIKGNGFLHNMVRTIVGTLLWVSHGKIQPEDIKDIIKSEDRKKAGPTVPAKGLCLVKVNYELS